MYDRSSFHVSQSTRSKLDAYLRGAYILFFARSDVIWREASAAVEHETPSPRTLDEVTVVFPKITEGSPPTATPIPPVNSPVIDVGIPTPALASTTKILAPSIDSAMVVPLSAVLAQTAPTQSSPVPLPSEAIATTVSGSTAASVVRSQLVQSMFCPKSSSPVL